MPSLVAYSSAQSRHSTMVETPWADTEISELIATGEHHAAAAFASAFAFGLDILGDIELPPGSESQVDRAQMRALGALYLAADLEPAGIISAADNLAALTATGALNLNLGPVSNMLHDFWRERHRRVNATERATFYGRLFGASYGPAPADGVTNPSFEPLMLELCESLYRLDERISHSMHGGLAQSTRVRSAARNLLLNLATAGGGVTPFLATEIMATLNQGLAILKHPHLRGIFAGRDLWDVVAAINRRAGIQSTDPRIFVRRGRAGMRVIIWLADAAENLRHYGQPIVSLDNPVVSAAVEWLQSSLTISEHINSAPTQQSQGRPTMTDASPWAELGI